MTDNCIIAVHSTSTWREDKFDHYNASQISKFSQFNSYDWRSQRRGGRANYSSTCEATFQPIKRPRESTLLEQTALPFFDLPAELREKILEHVLQKDEETDANEDDVSSNKTDNDETDSDDTESDNTNSDDIDSNVADSDDTDGEDTGSEDSDRDGPPVRVEDTIYVEGGDPDPFTSIIVVDRTDEDYDETESRNKFVKQQGFYSWWPKGWIPRRDQFRGMCIYFPASVMQLFVSRQYLEEALRILSRTTPLDITAAQMDLVIPRLAQYPVVQRILEIVVENTRSLTMSTAPTDLIVDISHIPQQPSFPTNQCFQHLKEINLACNPLLHWRSLDGDGKQGSFLVDRRTPWKDKNTEYELRRDYKTLTYRIPWEEAEDHEKRRQCFSALIPILRSTLLDTEGYKNAKNLVELFRDHNIRPKVLFWQRIEYAQKYDRWEQWHGGHASMVIAIDVENFEIIHFAADIHPWNDPWNELGSYCRSQHSGAYYNEDLTFRPGREIESPRKSRARFRRLEQTPKFSRKIWKERQINKNQ